MGDTKHTPGPWLVSPFKAVVITGEFGKDGDFLPVAAMLWPTDERSEAETYANAHLIAAAPDLYAACAAAEEYLSCVLEGAAEVREACTAALRKARGEVA